MNMVVIIGNPIYISALHSAHENIHCYYDRFLAMENRELYENYKDLCEIIQAVENGQADLAHKLARNHVLRFNRFMEMRSEGKENARGQGRRTNDEGLGTNDEGLGTNDERQY